MSYLNDICESGGMVDAMVSKTISSDTVWVQVPSLAPVTNLFKLFELYIERTYKSSFLCCFLFIKETIIVYCKAVLYFVTFIISIY